MYISNPHFYLADPKLLEAVDGLKPNQSLHESYFKIQPVNYIDHYQMDFLHLTFKTFEIIILLLIY